MQIGNVILRYKRIAAAYLVRKRVELFDETNPFFALGLVPFTGGGARWTEADVNALIQHVTDELDGIALPVEVMTFVMHKDSPIARRSAEVDRACLYDCNRVTSSPG